MVIPSPVFASNPPELALGTVQWGMPYGIANEAGQPSDESVQQMLATAARHHITMLDTARAYGDSEEVLGRCLNGTHAWKIFTKIAPPTSAVDDDETLLRSATDSLEATRRALHRDTLDAVLLHRGDQYGRSPWDLLRQQRSEGRLTQIGYSAMTPDEAWLALRRPDVEIIQVAGSWFDQRLLRAGWFQQARHSGMMVVLRSIFLQGAALMPPESLPVHLAPIAPYLRRLDHWADARQLDRLTAVLAITMHYPVDAVLIGCETPEQLNKNLAAWQTATRWRGQAEELLERIPDLPESIIHPANWPPKPA